MALQQYFAGHRVSLPPVVRLYFLCRGLRALPFPGSLVEQPAHIVDSFELIDQIVATEEEKRRVENIARLFDGKAR